MSELLNQLEREILPFVQKPGRYVGNELNLIKKEWDKVDVHLVLAFPDLYELGMSYMGFSILYHILNKQEHILAERVFAPWPDMQDRLAATGIPLFSLESFRPLSDFDIVGFTFQYELHLTNILSMLKLSGIPLRVQQREKTLPLIIGGGPCAFNPEPAADFFDLFVIGDAEEAFLEVVAGVQEAKVKKWERQHLLKELAAVPGIYVPEFYRAQYSSDGIFTGMTVSPGVPQKVVARTQKELQSAFYPVKAIVPIIEVTHDRLSVEIARGCSRGCRFCSAGILYRPVRARRLQEVITQVKKSLNATGYDEISLVSLSTSDYRDLEMLLSGLRNEFAENMVTILLPSLRPEKFTPEIATQVKEGRRSGMTLAPEAGTDRLRHVINKNNTSQDLIQAAELAYRMGWHLIKLYFMIGLPTETDDDLEGIVQLIHEILKIGKRYGSNKKLNVSISPFIPKSHTPFQWAYQDNLEEMQRKFNYLKSRFHSKNLKIFMRMPEVAKLEAVIARGDRRLAAVVETAWKNGARFDAWTEYFDFSIWQRALEHHGLSIELFDREHQVEEILPWDHIDKGITKEFLLDEYLRARDRVVTPDCRDGKCCQCGLMEQKLCQELLNRGKENKIQKPNIKITDASGSGCVDAMRIKPTQKYPTVKLRMCYQRGREQRFFSHLDLMRLFSRAFRRAQILLVYSEGFNPHPKIASSPPLATGYLSEAEYLDFSYYDRGLMDIQLELERVLPSGLKIVEIRPVHGKSKALSAIINRIDYQVQFVHSFDKNKIAENCQRFLAEKEIVMKRTTAHGSKELDIRPFIQDIRPTINDSGIYLTTVYRNSRTARVEEVLRWITRDEKISLSAIITRTGQFIQNGDIMLTPMEV